MSTVFSAEEKETRLFIGDLIDRDSPMSSFYNHSAIPSEILINSLQHSISRANRLSSSTSFAGKWFSSDLERSIVPKYFMKIYIGSRKQEMKVAIDTTSNLLWIKCKSLYDDDDAMLIFYKAGSGTYKELFMNSPFCQELDETYPGELNGRCEYTYNYYMYHGWTKGVLSNDSFHLRYCGGKLREFESVAFGCATSYPEMWRGREIQGIIGLGRGSLSFVRQKEANIQYKFSYCLYEVMNVYHGKIIFGSVTSRYDAKTFTTPMVDKNRESLYQISLLQISVQRKKTSYPQDAGYMILDPGTEHTFLRQDLYKEFRTLLKDAIPYEQKHISLLGNLGLCYPMHTAGEHIRSLEIIFHFDGGKITLPYKKTFVEFGVFYCSTILPHRDLSIFGGLAQVNLKVEYNLRDELVSFTPKDCTLF